jgi:hypothetical protein
MRALALTLAACGGGAAPTPVAHVTPAGEGVRITLAPPAVGDRRTVTSTMRMEADATMPDGTARHIVIEDRITEEIEVLAVSGGAQEKVRVRYPLAHRTRTMGQIRSDEDKPVEGHTYVVWLEGGEIRAARDDGAALHEAEQQHLVDAWDDDLGRVDPLLVLVADEPWTLGAGRELRAEEVAALHFGDDETRISSASIALAGTSASTATFELDVVMHGDDAGDTIEIPARVMVELARQTGRMMSMTIKGTMSGATDGMKMTGAIEAEQRWTYP